MFSQAEQIVNTDRFYAGTVRLLALIGVSIIAGLWLFFGKLTFYETSSHIETTDDNLIRATFTNEEVEMIAVEQTATVLFTDADEVEQTAVVLIARITPSVDNEHTQLDLLVTDREVFIALFGETAVVQSVTIESGRVSPIRFIVEAAGLVEVK